QATAPATQATSSRTRSTPRSPSMSPAVSPWPTPVPIPTARSSSLPKLQFPTSTASTPSSASATHIAFSWSVPSRVFSAMTTTSPSLPSLSTKSPSCVKDSPCRRSPLQRQLPQPQQSKLSVPQALERDTTQTSTFDSQGEKHGTQARHLRNLQNL